MTLGSALASSVLLWAALPPLDLWPLAWVAPIGWLWLIRRGELAGEHPYRLIWLAGFCFWFAALHWLRLPHWATSFGWVAVSIYLAFYLPAFIALSRVAVHRLGVSVIVAAPVVWTGLELVRAYMVTGFRMASLGHTQYRWIELIQLSDVTGAYGVCFLVMFVAACLTRMLPCEERPRAFWPAGVATAAMACAIAYGSWRTGEIERREGPTIALVQGSIDTEIKNDPNEHQRVFHEYFSLSRRASAADDSVELIVWPETMFPYAHIVAGDDARPGADDEWTSEDLEFTRRNHRLLLSDTVRALQVPVLVGIDVHEYGPGTLERYNSALLVDREDRVAGRYDKHHRVLFGEYVPLANYFPFLYRLTPLAGGVEPGTNDEAFEVGGAKVAANICYESVLPHVIRRQVRRLADADAEPDVLVNLTNDGWFWGSSELDMHLACGVFRAIECRKPYLIAANTGISASIDSEGRIVERGPRRETDVLVARPMLDDRQSPYLRYGDWLAGASLAFCVAMAGVGGAAVYRERKRDARDDS